MPKKSIPKEKIEEYKRMVDIVNKRLKRIETDYSKRAGYEAIKEYAYYGAKQDIKKIWGPDALKFSKKIPTGKNAYREFQKMFAAVEKFYGAQSSTLKGIKTVYENRAATLNKKYDWNLSWTDLAKMFESGMYEKLKASGYGSDTIFKTIAVIQKNEAKIMSERESIKVIGGNRMVHKIANDFIDKNRDDVKGYFNSL